VFAIDQSVLSAEQTRHLLDRQLAAMAQQSRLHYLFQVAMAVRN
jgi:hypothetical protein